MSMLALLQANDPVAHAEPSWVTLTYLVAAILFIFGLKGLTHPRTAVRGNLLSAVGMLVAIVVTLIHWHILSSAWVLVGLAIGSIVGGALAVRIQMTAMPQMVAAFNGLGGGASAFVAGYALAEPPIDAGTAFYIATFLSTVIGAVTLSGSMVAFAKLQELMSGQAIRFPAQGLVNAALFLICVGVGVFLTRGTEYAMAFYWALFSVATILGVLLVIPIGGADMPVVISLL
ncbi:MAG: NAD(P)(+) transhydrogenase (Re/Si-specific) subunit beta, partial [Planctomycetes bacterium]|nr:NAD(P)(+) transhydrogenase (Re/Si-specific) subunit beta [Planctomycetota bacterium]